MSERDTVHKEMNKLTEDLTQAYKKIKILENEVKDHVEQVLLSRLLFVLSSISSSIAFFSVCTIQLEGHDYIACIDGTFPFHLYKIRMGLDSHTF